MRCIATFDIGTTAVKAVVVDSDGRVLASDSRVIPTIFVGEAKEQNPEEWWKAFCSLSHDLIGKDMEVAGIVMSGQMQDVIPVDEQLKPVRNAILYSDCRASAQATQLLQKLGGSAVESVTGNHCDGSLSLPKIMWMKKNEPELYEKTKSFLISSKDYVIAQLTGVCAGDLTACSTACAMDIRNGKWDESLLQAADIEKEKMPLLFASHDRVGTVQKERAQESGYPAGTPVFAGVGDAGATTLASGIMDIGQYNVNLGTSGWVASVSDEALQSEYGVFNLAAMPEKKVINVVPFLNAGNVHRWVSGLFTDRGQPDYAQIDAMISATPAGSNGVMALPYLLGERFPVLDSAVRGTFVGLTMESTKADMTRAMLEGVCFSIRQGIDCIGERARSISVIGGGGRVKAWCQMLCDVLGEEVRVYKNSDTLPARAIACAALIGLGEEKGYTDYILRLQKENADCYMPDPAAHEEYTKLYQRYIELYPIMKQWYKH